MTDQSQAITAPSSVSTDVPNVVSTFSAVKLLDPSLWPVATQMAQNLDPADSRAVMALGAEAQRGLDQVMQPYLERPRSREGENATQAITDLISSIKELRPQSLLEPPTGLVKLLRQSPLLHFMDRFNTVNKKLEKIEKSIEAQKTQLHQDNVQLEMQERANAQLYQELLVAIAAGKSRLARLRVEQSDSVKMGNGDQQGMLRTQELEKQANLLEQRVYSLIVASYLSIQNTAQIRLIRQGNERLQLKLEEATNTTLPIWRRQIVTVLAIFNQQKAADVSQQLSDVTNDLMRQSAEFLQLSATKVAQESQRSVVEIQTLAEVNQRFIATLEAVQQIDDQRRSTQQEAENAVMGLQNQLLQSMHTIQQHQALGAAEQANYLLTQGQVPDRADQPTITHSEIP